MLHRLSRIRGFHVRGTDGAMGHVDDFIVDEANVPSHELTRFVIL